VSPRLKFSGSKNLWARLRDGDVREAEGLTASGEMHGQKISCEQAFRVGILRTASFVLRGINITNPPPGGCAR